jgi:WhiB family redox-sensing transcriptional regulator
MNWQSAASCVGKDPSLFFAPEAETAAARRVREIKAKLICARCPVALPCLVFGESQEDGVREHGLYGGLNGTERKRLRRRVQRSVRSTPADLMGAELIRQRNALASLAAPPAAEQMCAGPCGLPKALPEFPGGRSECRGCLAEASRQRYHDQRSAAA